MFSGANPFAPENTLPIDLQPVMRFARKKERKIIKHGETTQVINKLVFSPENFILLYPRTNRMYMRGIVRKFAEDVYQHIYQNTISGWLVFYTWEDRLMYFTLFSVLGEKYKVKVLGLTLMYDHIHSLIMLPSRETMGRFIGEVTSRYVLAFNRDCGRKGPLFRKAYGNAMKVGDKKMRTIIAYLANNSAEKHLVVRAEHDRWNFLAYLNSNHPFSEPVDRHRISRKLLRSLRTVDSVRCKKRHLPYGLLRSLFDGLEPAEREQLMDYIISVYLPIDKERLSGYFKSYDDMLLAINSNTGSEYDLKEDYDSDSHQIYRRMLDLVARSSFSGNVKGILTAPEGQKRNIADVLMHRTGAKWYQVKKLLHL